jgi:molecular chaperone GrpE (heat shock protein)
MSDYEDWKRETSDIAVRLEAQIGETQAEADARLELEAERVERAREWERAQSQVKNLRARFKLELVNHSTTPYIVRVEVERLLAALDELERLEERGV